MVRRLRKDDIWRPVGAPKPPGPVRRSLIRLSRYNCLAPELLHGRHAARKFMHKYNHHLPDDSTPESLYEDRLQMLKGIMGGVGKGTYIEPPINIDYGCNIVLGENFYSNFKYVCRIVYLTYASHQVSAHV